MSVLNRLVIVISIVTLFMSSIAGARDPILMASAMRKAIEAGREAFLAGRIPRKRFANASSPMSGLIE